MATMVFVNYPVKDVQASTEFYAKLGFKKNEEFSNERSSSMVWDCLLYTSPSPRDA